MKRFERHSPSTDNERFEVIDSRPRKPVLILIVFITLYVILFGTVVLFGVRELVLKSSFAGAMLLASGYLLIALLLVFYKILTPYRFKFKEHGVETITWRGRQFFLWSDVKRASLSSYKQNVDLVLHLGGLRYITIPINSFRRGASLLSVIRLKLPVQVSASQRQLTLITDD